MSVRVRLPSYNTPVLSVNGCFTREWFQFQQNMYDRTGGDTDKVATASSISELTTVGTIERIGTDQYATYTVTGFAKTVLLSADSAEMRAAIGLGTAATANIGTSGASVPLLSANNTWSGAQVFGTVTLGNVLATTSTSATGGSATALPAQPVGYKTEVINGVSRKIPYYD